MLDTDVASYVIKGTAPAIDKRLSRLDTAQVCISAITRAELRFGARRIQNAFRLAAEVEKFLMGVGTVAWDEAAADKFAEVRVNLERVGTPIGAFDTMIAAHAMAAKVTLVTNNEKHFRLVKGLAVENWAESTRPSRT